MSIDVRYLHLAAAVDYLIAKRQSSFVPPRLVIVHGYRRPGTVCLPGESIESAHLQYSPPDMVVPVRLSLAGLIVCDCMVRFHHTLLSTRHMERIVTSDPFYRHLGANSFERIKNVPKFTRTSLRVYVARMREQIAKAMKEGGSLLSAEDALASETTDSNVVVHRLNLPVDIIHRDC